VSIDRTSKEKEKIQQMLPPSYRLSKKSPRVSSPGARGDDERRSVSLLGEWDAKEIGTRTI